MQQVIVITGATSGIGYALTTALLEENVSVIGIGRSEILCKQVEAQFRERFPQVKVHYCIADLSSQRQVRRAAGEIKSVLEDWNRPGLDGLINNAGTFTFWRSETSEGFETQWAVNHLAPFLLSQLLLPVLQEAPGAKVITITSGSHQNVNLRWDDLQLARRYNPLQAYKQTKLANILFTYEFNQRLSPKSTVRAFAANPGLVNTDIGNKTGLGLARWFWAFRRRKGISPEESARGILALLMNPHAAYSGEIYWKHGQPATPDPQGLDPIAKSTALDNFS